MKKSAAIYQRKDKLYICAVHMPPDAFGFQEDETFVVEGCDEAAAGLAAGVGSAVGGDNLTSLRTSQSIGNIASHLGVGAGRSIAAAATRSVIEGTSFGDNIIATLPDVLAQTVVDVLAGAVTGRAAAQSAAAGGVISGDGFNYNALYAPLLGGTPSALVGPTIEDGLNFLTPADRHRFALRTAARHPEMQARVQQLHEERVRQQAEAGNDGNADIIVTARTRGGNGRPAYSRPSADFTWSQLAHDASYVRYMRGFTEGGSTAAYNDVVHRQALAGYAAEQVYIDEMNDLAFEQLDKPLLYFIGGSVVMAATGGAGAIAIEGLGLTGWTAVGAGAAVDGVAAANGGVLLRPALGEEVSARGYATDFAFGAGGSLLFRGGAYAFEARETARLGRLAGGNVGASAHPLAGFSSSEVIDMTLSRGVQTPRDSLILWSGFGRDGVDVSQAFAREYGGMTLEMTPGGSWLNSMKIDAMNSPFSRIESEAIFGAVSSRMVGQASGQVRSLLGNVRPNSVYKTYELPALRNNPAILGLDPLQVRSLLRAGGH